jgi:hypothetical protein
MLILECPYCGVMAGEMELAPGCEAHLKRFGPGSSPARLGHPKNRGIICSTRHSNVLPIGRVVIAELSRRSHGFFTDLRAENPICERTHYDEYKWHSDERRHIHGRGRKYSSPKCKIGPVSC